MSDAAFEEMRARIEAAKQMNPQIEEEMREAVEFANQHLQRRSTAFTGALLGIMVGALFAHQPPDKFDEWARLIGDDLKRKRMTPTPQ